MDDVRRYITERLGALHARQRIGIETEHEARVFGEGIGFFHLENWYSARSIIRNSLRLTGLYGRARRNALAIGLVENALPIANLPPAFEGFRILHVTDVHIDMHPTVPPALIERVRDVDYDLCVLTGDYRSATHGSIVPTLEGMARLRPHLRDEVYGVFGNHDSILMLPELERMGIRMLVNESVAVQRGDAALHLAGIDDAHYFRVDNIEKAAAIIPADAPSILLSHTPEVFRQAAHAGFSAMLSGHTHGGQICLPGGFPITLDARIPRRLGRGAWHHHGMSGYTSPGSGTSMVQARINCPPEVTVHRLVSTGGRPGRSGSPGAR